MTHMQETAVEAVHRNSGRLDGLMDQVIDGPAGTGKTCDGREVGQVPGDRARAAGLDPRV
ncbi:hypothetical protein [Streptomyces sp. HUAS TT7]|uniref:hypothetical protein n=1 Tax=Streptomyces sp. HUAS TT7 TaxID=3447507 RepID=UPI003F65CB08